MDAHSLHPALAGTRLAGRAIIELEIPDFEASALAIPVAAEELEADWRAARALVDATGRWPIAVVGWSGTPEPDWESAIRGGGVFSRFYFDEAPRPQTAVEILADADRVTPEQIDEFVAKTREECRAFEREVGAEPYSWWEGPEAWFDFSGMHGALVFLPVQRSWDALAFINFYGSAALGIPEIIALGRRWEDRYGAELVSHYGTMLQCLVSRPPTRLDEATELAREQFAIAPCTFILPGDTPAQVAPRFVGGDRWFLHERP